MSYGDYIDSDRLTRLLTGWGLTPTSTDISDSADEVSGWLEMVTGKHSPHVHNETVLRRYATNKAACYIATQYLGGHVTSKDQPVFMSVCSSCNRFEKMVPSDFIKTISTLETRRGVD